jgi:cytochrome c
MIRISQMAAVAGLAGMLAACASPSSDGVSGLSGAARGERIAAESCASCHAIGGGPAASAVAAAPTFASLARRPGMTRAALSALLRTPHETMPNLILTGEEIDDLAAYLATLQ